MGSNRGTTLLETLVAVALSGILFASFFTVFGQTQTVVSNLNLLLERDQNLSLLPLLLSRWIPSAGNNRRNFKRVGWSIESERLYLNSDTDGPSGFPDGKLRAPFEGLVLKCEKGHLKVKSGRGGFQPILKNIREWELTSRNRKIEVRVSAELDHPYLNWKYDDVEQVHLDFFLRNYRANLFAENP